MLEHGKSGATRGLGFGSSFFLVVASMVGAGVFTTSGFLAASLRDEGDLIWAWVLGGLLAAAGALCFAELGAMMPRAGGEYAYVREVFGARTGFLCGFVSLLAGFAAPIAGVGLGVGEYGTSLGLPTSPRLIAVAVILLVTAMHAWGLRPGLLANNAATALKIALCLLFVGAGFLVTPGAEAADEVAARPLAEAPGLMSAAFASALVLVAFAYTGWNAAAYLAEETRDPEKNVPRALCLGTAFVTALYVLLNLVFLRGAPIEVLQGEAAVGHLAAVRLFGERAGGLFGIGFALILISTISAFVLAGPRILWAMASRGQLPAALAQRNEAGSPTRALWLQAALASGIVMFAALDDLLRYIGLTLSLFAGLAVLSLVVLRARDPERARPFRVPLYPLPPLIFLTLSAWMVIWSVKDDWRPAAASAATLALALLAERAFRRSDA